jgi:hypothetical protein
MALWIACLTGLAVVVDLPVVNESKLIFPLFLLLSIPISIAVYDILKESEGMRRILLTALVILLFAAPALMTLRGMYLEIPRSEIEARRDGITVSDRKLLQWIRANTDKYAVFMENNHYNLIPALAGRRNFFPTEQAIKVNGYRGTLVDRYRETRDTFFSGREIPLEMTDFLRERGIDLYVLISMEDMSAEPGIERPFNTDKRFEMRYQDNEVSVYRLLP